MKLHDAYEKLIPFVGIKFKELMANYNIEDIIINKGKTGQLLEILLGLKNSNAPLDFEDGELKTNKCKANGSPIETMFITQIMSIVDELLSKKPFVESRLFTKIDNLLYVPICKVGDPIDWYIMNPTHINLENKQFENLKIQLENDYNDICAKMINDISINGAIHTSSGKYIQIRTKDSKPYHPIFSKLSNKTISNKNFAFYFKKEFMKEIVNTCLL